MTDILALGAHPDDIEFGCGGILAKAAAQGYTIVMADLTIGEKATHGTPEQRRQEGKLSSHVIGAKRVVMDFADCEIMDNYEGRLKLVKLFRDYRPRLIIAPIWKGEQNHPDHIACGLLARHACRYARFSKILPEIAPHAIEGILHYTSYQGIRPDFLIDVSDHIETWINMMDCHQSQHLTHPYKEWVLRQASQLGSMIGKNYAQGLVAGNPVVVEDLMQISKGIREL